MNSSAANEGVGTAITAGIVTLLFIIFLAAFVFFVIQSFRRKKKGWIIGAVISGVLFLFSGVAALGVFAQVVSKAIAEGRGTDGPLGENRDIFYGPNQETTLRAPASWKIMPELRADALIGAGSTLGSSFVMVIEDPKEDFAGTLDDFDQITADGMLSSLEGSHSSDPEIRTINGLPARYRRVTGTAEKIRLVYYRLSVESVNSFYQVIVWTTASRDKMMAGELTAILESFTAAAGPPGPDQTASGTSAAPDTRAALTSIIAEILQLDKDEVTESSRFADLGDDLDRIEIVMAVEESFQVEIPDEFAEKMGTVGDLGSWLDQRKAVPAEVE